MVVAASLVAIFLARGTAVTASVPLIVASMAAVAIVLLEGLLIASVKASLVMYIFMHLNHEKKLIYLIYGMAGFFAHCLFLITKMAFADPIHYPGFSKGEPVIEEKVENH